MNISSIVKAAAGLVLFIASSVRSWGQETASAAPQAQFATRAIVLEGLESATSLHPVFGQLPGTNETCMLVGCRIRDGKDTRGRLRVFRNCGTSTKPQYGDGYWLDEKVPSARIPGG